ncbi:MAG: metal dependent phosphohydrolase [Candidatus Magnetoglobus multicellularis str. Araruama]|uniref:Metal dependent phosphohydrolase n=1 Tax=Candidatus Magnetoglobus multicellularis str. Araruama TaxID=890399 RepID=A0A1V1P907_9BACT|nr:MAG: metal dependent phosphohydrolase [Candidatus Magnetoglobus multicellularis str. Araruama]
MSEQKPYVIICSDLPETMDQLTLSLSRDYHLFCINRTDVLIETAVQKKPEIILINVIFNKADSIACCAQLSGNVNTADIPVIFISEVFDQSDTLAAFQAGAADFMKYAYHEQELKARMENHIHIKQSREKLVHKHQELNATMTKENERLQNLMIATIRAIVQTVESRDPYTSGHQQRVSDLATEIAMRMGLDHSQKMSIKYAGLLHDIGKLRVPEAILNRPGKLLDMEFDVLKVHPKIGSDILETVPSPWPLARIVLEHHERLDGSGYPNGLTDNEILIESKVLAVADVMEAMSSHRPYRPSQGVDLALKEINSQKGLLYDTNAVDICTQLFNQHDYKFGW